MFIFLAVKKSYLIYVLLKKNIFFGEIFTIFYTFLHNFIKKKNTKINLKIGTKSSDWKFYRDQKVKKIIRGTKIKGWYIYRDQKHI